MRSMNLITITISLILASFLGGCLEPELSPESYRTFSEGPADTTPPTPEEEDLDNPVDEPDSTVPEDPFKYPDLGVWQRQRVLSWEPGTMEGWSPDLTIPDWALPDPEDPEDPEDPVPNPVLPPAVDSGDNNPCTWDSGDEPPVPRSGFVSDQPGSLRDLVEMADGSFMFTGSSGFAAATYGFGYLREWVSEYEGDYGGAILSEGTNLVSLGRTDGGDLQIVRQGGSGELLSSTVVNGENLHVYDSVPHPNGYVVLYYQAGTQMHSVSLLTPEGETMWELPLRNAHQLVQTERGFAVVGASEDWLSTWVREYDLDGTLVWEASIEMGGVRHRRLAVTEGGEFVVTTASYEEAYVSLLSHEGGVLWTSVLQSPSDQSYEFNAVAVAVEGIYVGGRRYNGDNTQTGVLFLLDAEGSPLGSWDLASPNPYNDTSVLGIHPLPEGGAVAHGVFDHKGFWQIVSPLGFCTEPEGASE